MLGEASHCGRAGVRCSRQRACPAAERDSEHPVDPRAHEGQVGGGLAALTEGPFEPCKVV